MKSLGFLWGGIGIAGAVAGGWWWYEREVVPPPQRPDSIWPVVAAYHLRDGQGVPVSLTAVEGKVVLLTFVYTRCASVCPRLQGRIREVLAALPPSSGVVALSLSLDPERDTAGFLSAYAQSYAVPGHTWFYWRPSDQRWALQLARSVFNLTAVPLEGEEILHSDAIFLIDCEGRVRGVYSSEDSRILTHTKKLLRVCGTPS
ncbi:MAG: SCO family protein [Bacteroidia bacterium]|nr:SCO family protein [Bacteroidia bacterium]